MPSEREIRKLYVNGRTICIEFFILLISIFHRLQDTQPSPEGTILGAWGDIPQQEFGRYYPAKNAKHIHVCIACRITFDYFLLNISTSIS